MRKTTLLSLLSLLLLVSGRAWAATEVVIDFTAQGYANAQDVTSLTVDGVTVTLKKGTNSNAPKFYTSGTAVRCYGGNTLTLSADNSITGVVFTFGSSDGTNEITASEGSYADGTWEGSADEVIFTIGGTKGNRRIAKLVVTLDDGGVTPVTVNKPVITPEGGSYDEGDEVEVTITADEGCTIIYTTDGIVPSAAAGSYYREPFTVSETTTVKAVAMDAEGNTSGVTTATFTFARVYQSIRELCADATSTSTPVTVNVNNWVVTAVKGTTNAYFTDGTNGIQLYQNGHGFTVGDKISGTVNVNLITFNGAAELTGLTASTAGLSIVEQDVEVEPLTPSIAELDNTHQGNLITLKGVTCVSKKFVDADGNDITPYGTFITLPTLEEGKVYDATGIFVWYRGTKEIAPRTADDFVLATTSSVALPVITPNGGAFVDGETVEVTITAEEGCGLIYTNDGTDPTTSETAVPSETNEVSFRISENTTLSVVAIDQATGAFSDVATAEFTFLTPLMSIEEVNVNATEEEQTVLVQLDSWVCTGAASSNAYFSDGVNGIQLYQSGHGFKAGDKLSGTAKVTLVLFQGKAEVKGLTATTEGVSVEPNYELTPADTPMEDLDYGYNQGTLVTFYNVTYEGGKLVNDDDNSITLYDKFGVKYAALEEGLRYNVTGVILWYVKNGEGEWQIAPRTADEIELLSKFETPESSWDVADEVVVDINDEFAPVFTTTSDGAITYTSSDEAVATINGEGGIVLVAPGTTVITASTDRTDTFLADSKSFTLTVTKDGYADCTFRNSDEDILGKGASGAVGIGFTAERNGVVTLTFNNAYGNRGYIQFYGNSTMELSVADGYVIDGILIVTTKSADYPRYFEDQFGHGTTLDPLDEGETVQDYVRWEGMQNKVVLTNVAAKQARITGITVSYIKLRDTGRTVTISEAGLATYYGGENVVIAGEEQCAIAGAISGANGAVLSVDTLTSCIPGAVPVLLMGVPGEYKVYTHPDLYGNRPNENLLVGVREDTPAPVGSYVLQQQETVGFFEVVEGEDVIVPAWHAYLQMPNVAGVPAFFFTEEDYETGISTLATEQQNGEAVYNLAGQRLQKMQKGINIVGGKKILK